MTIHHSGCDENAKELLDKDFVVIEGATHGISPCTACEKTPGQYSNATKNWTDYVVRWIDARF
jgi:hypothetical protein